MNTNILDRYFNNYLKMKNRRENTIQTYKYNMSQFYNYFSELLHTDDEIELLKKITNDMIEDYVEYLLLEKKYSASSMNNKINTWKSFYKYVYKNKKIIEVNPIEHFPEVPECLSTKEKKDKEILTPSELEKVLECSYNKLEGERMFHLCSTRDRFIMAFTYTTGSRIEEILQAEFPWLEKIEDGYMINIPSTLVKNKIDKRLPITGKVLKYFNEYLIERSNLKKIKDEDIIILSSKGRKVTTKDCNESLEKLLKKAEINKHITSHCGRHYFSTILTSRGDVSENIINRIGGWKMEGIKNNFYCHDEAFDNEKIRVCNSLLS